MSKAQGGIGILGGFLLFVGLFGCLVLLWFFVFRAGPPVRQTVSAAERMRDFPKSDERATASNKAVAERLVEAQAKRVESSSNLEGQDRRVGEVFAAELEILLTKAKERDAAYDAAEAAGFAVPGFASIEEISARKEFVKNWEQSDQALVRGYQDVPKRLMDGMLLQGVSQPTLEGNTAAFLTAVKAEQSVQLWDTDAQAAKAVIEMLELYASEWGRWKADDSGYVDFTDDNVEAKFNRLKERVGVLLHERQELVSELGIQK